MGRISLLGKAGIPGFYPELPDLDSGSRLPPWPGRLKCSSDHLQEVPILLTF